MWFWVIVVVLMIGAITVLLVGSGSSLSEAYEDRPDQTIPVGRPLTADDLEDIRFTTAVRGYRMDEVDALVDRLRADLLVRELERERERERERETDTGEGAGGAPEPGYADPSVAVDRPAGTTLPFPVVSTRETDSPRPAGGAEPGSRE